MYALRLQRSESHRGIGGGGCVQQTESFAHSTA